MEKFKKQLGENIKNSRKKLRLSITEFAKGVKVSANSVKSWEKAEVLIRGKSFLKILAFIKKYNIKCSVLFENMDI